MVDYIEQQFDTHDWKSYFDDTKWEVHGNFPWSSWTGTSWHVGQEEAGEFYDIRLDPIGGWEVDFRPTKVRITHTFVNAATVQNDFILHNTCLGGGCPDFVATDANLVSLEEKDCFFDGYDIDSISFGSEEEEGDWYITNIEFY